MTSHHIVIVTPEHQVYSRDNGPYPITPDAPEERDLPHRVIEREHGLCYPRSRATGGEDSPDRPLLLAPSTLRPVLTGGQFTFPDRPWSGPSLLDQPERHEFFATMTRSFAELGQQLHRASRQARRAAARAGTRGRRGARSLAPFGLPWAMYRGLHEEEPVQP